MKEISVVGIDLAKLVFQVVGLNKEHKVVLRKRLPREKLAEFVHNLPAGTKIGMECCSGAHYWGRKFTEFGYEVRLMPPQYVKPYVKTNKNDDKDAEAIAEAATRPTMRFAPVKTLNQQDIQALHRVRQRLVSSRTRLVNEVRGLLAEYGIIIPQSVNQFRKELIVRLEKESQKLTGISIEMFNNLHEEFIALEARIAVYDKKLEMMAKEHPVMRRLKTIPGVGPLTASSIVAAVGDISHFKNGRQFAAWLGLVPRQHSSGGKDRLLGISKRGNVYLRQLLVHGARTVMRWAKDKTDRISVWAYNLSQRRGVNKAVVALANKNARIIWAVLTRDEDYRVA